jgi:hypothetical protein
MVDKIRLIDDIKASLHNNTLIRPDAWASQAL